VSVIARRDGVFDDHQAAILASSDSVHWWFASKAAIVKDLLDRFAGDQDGPIVDIGAGAGGVTERLRGAGLDPVAVEGSGELSRACRARGLPVVRAVTAGLPLATSSASAVTLLDVIEHLDDPVPSLREARRILKPGGVLVVSVPAHGWLWSDADAALGHVKRYNRALLRRELRCADLDPIWCSHVFSWLVPPVWAARKAARRSPDEQLGLDVDGAAIRSIARVLTAAELRLVGRVGLPLGTSVAAVARREN
jgi:SAM-dependent methyltransferase